MEICNDYIQTSDMFYSSDHVLRTLWTSMLRSLWRMLQLLRWTLLCAVYSSLYSIHLDALRSQRLLLNT